MKIHKSEFMRFEMELVGICNLNCPLCTKNYKHANHMYGRNIRPLEEITAQLDEYQGFDQTNIAGTLSEPTLYPQFFELLEYLNKRDIQIDLFSNASIRDTDYWEKIGRTLKPKDRVIFTICGSTQELHGKYRIGSKLSKVLENAEAFRKGAGPKKNDYIQYIRFVYNAEDFESEATKEICDRFNNTVHCDSEGVRLYNEYNNDFDTEEIAPLVSRAKLIKHLFNNRPKKSDSKDYKILCDSIKKKSIYINQYGKVYPCYSYVEFQPNEDLIADNDGYFDYSKILNFQYEDCFKCENRTKCLIDKLDLDFLC